MSLGPEEEVRSIAQKLISGKIDDNVPETLAEWVAQPDTHSRSLNQLSDLLMEYYRSKWEMWAFPLVLEKKDERHILVSPWLPDSMEKELVEDTKTFWIIPLMFDYELFVGLPYLAGHEFDLPVPNTISEDQVRRANIDLYSNPDGSRYLKLKGMIWIRPPARKPSLSESEMDEKAKWMAEKLIVRRSLAHEEAETVFATLAEWLASPFDYSHVLKTLDSRLKDWHIEKWGRWTCMLTSSEGYDVCVSTRLPPSREKELLEDTRTRFILYRELTDYEITLCVSEPTGSSGEQYIYNLGRLSENVISALQRANIHVMIRPDGTVNVKLRGIIHIIPKSRISEAKGKFLIYPK